MRLKGTILVAGGVLTLGIMILAFVGFQRFVGGLEGYCDVRLTDDKKEVLYRLGFPPIVLGETESMAKDGSPEGRGWKRIYYTDEKSDPKNAMPANKHIEDFDEWSYYLDPRAQRDASIYVAFDRHTGKVTRISCVDTSNTTPHLCPVLAGVEYGNTEESVTHKLGKPDRSMIEGVSKTIRYDDLGIEFVLTKGKVYYLAILDKRSSGAPQFSRYLHTLLP